ncbi:zf-DHHC-domain-containing protein [Trametopsis cervina]|nr:zf-DHHC-domain-containing protein [Trametopsis cervina]
MGRLLGRVFASFTVFLIAFIGYTSQIWIIWPWYGHELSVQLIVLLLPFNALLGMLWWNYYLCVATNPGEVPKSWQPDFQGDEGYEVKKLTRRPRYCRTCENFKPPRAHHCRQCNRCVLRMDHHCPWINNCVGHFNQGHFIRFLFYVNLACSYHLVMVTRRVFYAMYGSFWDDPSASELIFIILNYTLCIPVWLAVGGFSIYHFNALCKNTTTIEGWEKDKAATLVRRGKIQEIKFPYNLGRRKNIESILGQSPLLWCCPTVTPGTGLKYPVSDFGVAGQEEWPPKDPRAVEHSDHKFELPKTPWTYENGELNPDLRPSSSALRKLSESTTARRKGRPKEPISAVPPYHPDYKPPGDDGGFSDSPGTAHSSSEEEEEEEDDDDDDDVPLGHSRAFVRRGSEGYEVRTIDREDMLRHHVVSQMGEPGRYNVYVPDPSSESEPEVEVEADTPVAAKVERWRASAAT